MDTVAVKGCMALGGSGAQGMGNMAHNSLENPVDIQSAGIDSYGIRGWPKRGQGTVSIQIVTAADLRSYLSALLVCKYFFKNF